MLLGDLGRCIHVARVQRRIFINCDHLERDATRRATRVELAASKIIPVTWWRGYRAVLGAAVPTLAVHDHARCQHEVPDPSSHGSQQHRGAKGVATHIRWKIAKIDAQPDHGGLVADDIDPIQSVIHDVRRPHVALAKLGAWIEPVRETCARSMRGWQQGVEHPDVMTPRQQPADDVRTDEPGSAGDQHVQALDARGCGLTGYGQSHSTAMSAVIVFPALTVTSRVTGVQPSRVTMNVYVPASSPPT
jgi:hypothetical protein